MEGTPTPPREARAFLVLLSGVLLLGAVVVFTSITHGHIPLLGTLPGDGITVLGTTPLWLPVGSCIVVSAVLTGFACIVSFLLRKNP
jgi:hypothetical protein